MPAIEKLKEFLGISEKHEIIASTEMALTDRIASPFYGYFLLSWLFFNWRIVYVSIFLDQSLLYQKTGLLRNEYLDLLIPKRWSLVFDFYFLVGPLILAVLMVWVFPYGTRIFYRKYIKNKVALKVIELQELRREKQEETELIKTEVEKAEVEKEAAETNPEIIWEHEFQRLRKNISEYWRLTRLREKAYADEGYIYNRERSEFSYFHVIGLFDFHGDQNHIKLTEGYVFFATIY